MLIRRAAGLSIVKRLFMAATPRYAECNDGLRVTRLNAEGGHLWRAGRDHARGDAVRRDPAECDSSSIQRPHRGLLRPTASGRSGLA